MGSKLGATLFALVFAIPFGGVGVLCSWGIAHMFSQSSRANDWVLVQAKVDDAALNASRGSKGGTTYAADGAYRYTIGGKEFVSTQLGFSLAGGSDSVGDWQESMAAFLEEAKRTGKTIPVYVNPDNPAEAVVDRDVRWAMVLFMGLFAVIFGGVGVGALAVIGTTWFGKTGKKRRKGKPGSVASYVAQRNRATVASAKPDHEPAGNPAVIASNARGKALGLWVFTAIWNLIAFPIAILTLPDLIAQGEWVGLLVLLFPLLGVLMLWGSIAQTVALLRRGKATLALNDAEPRMGGRLSGVVNFARAGRPAQEFEVRLLAAQNVRSGDDDSLVPRWWRDVNVRATADPRGGLRIPFQFDVPSRVNVPNMAPGEEPYALRWSIQVKPRGASVASDDFEILLQRSREPVENLPLPDPTPEERRNDAAIAKLLGAKAAADLTPEQRAGFAQLPPNAQAMVGKVVVNAGTIRKVAIGIAVAFAVLFVVAALVS